MKCSLRRTASRLVALVVLTVLFGSSLPPFVAAAQPSATGLSSSPAAVDETLALGATREVSFRLANSGAAALDARLYEGRAAGASLRSAPNPALARVPLPQQAERVDPQLGADLAAAPDGRDDFLIFLADQPDLSAAYAIAGWAERGEFVYRTLRDHAERSQAPLRAELSARGLRHEPLWVANAILVRDGDSADIAAVAGRADVALLRADRVTALDGAAAQPPAPEIDQVAACDPDAQNDCWNIVQVGADRVWENFGVRGEGVVVANIDSGVRYTHPALVAQYRGNRGGGQFSHSYSWFDAYGDSPAPVDSGNHGTHTMGTMVARGSADASAPAVGVAPGARWIAARACGTRECSESDLILAAQWMLAPTDLSGQNPRPDLRPHVVNNSWSDTGGDTWYAGYTAAWRAAGIFPVFAAGNTGNFSGCTTIQSPGDYSDVVGVGAVDRFDKLTYFSSIGPSADGRLKPDLTAPGFAVLSTMADPTRLYDTLNGTSMATPHVAAAVALLWSANPTLIGDYDTTYRLLTRKAEPLVGDDRYPAESHPECQPTTRPNNIYGWGRLDTYAAVAEARVDVPWLSLPGGALAALPPGGSAEITIGLDARRVPGPGVYEARVLVHGPDLGGAPLAIPVTLRVPADPSHATLSGVVRSAGDGVPLAAEVRVAGGASVRTDAAGRYTLTLPASGAPYTLTAAAPEYAAGSRSITLSPGQDGELDFALTALRTVLSVDAAPRAVDVPFGRTVDVPIALANTGTRELSYTLSLPAEPFGVWRSDEPDGPDYRWIAPPAGAISVPLLDDGVSEPIAIGFSFPFYDRGRASLQIGANGFLAFDPIPVAGTAFARVCLPVSNLEAAAVVALRVDLDPAQGGRVSYARIAEGFLVTWEDVPLHSDPARTLSFQALLRRDGRVSLSYRQLPDLELGDSASAGVQRGAEEGQSLGCNAGLILDDELTVELRPQASTALWMRLPATSGKIAPGGSAAVTVRLGWVRGSPGWLESGAVLLRSNDPLRPEVRLSLRARPADANFTVFLPRAPNGE